MSIGRLEARSNPPLWRLALCIPAIALLVWGVEEAATGKFEASDSWRTSVLYSVAPPWAVTLFFALCTVLVIALFLQQAMAKWRRPIVFVADDRGVTAINGSRQRTLEWREIQDLLEAKGLLEIVGRSSGKRVTLKVRAGELDVPRMKVLEAITSRRPDLLAAVVRNASAA